MTAVHPSFASAWDAEDVVWLRVEDDSATGAVRRRAAEVAERAGFDEGRVGEVAIVATELATNLLKYAEEGQVVLRMVRADPLAGVEVVALDHGPGMRNARSLFEDGESTSGTLGIGLGAVKRLASSYDVHSVPGRGTVVSARLWPRGAPESTGSSGERVSGLTRTLEGEDACGDAWAVRPTSRGVLLLACDGLGHGTLASKASLEAVRVFRGSAEESPTALLRLMHGATSGTRGAATAIGHLDLVANQLTYAGVGNIAGRIVGDGRPRGLVSLPGILGHKMPLLRDLTYDVTPDSWIVMHSDGLTDKWRLDAYPGLLTRSPVVLASTLLRDAAVHRDDASILVCSAGSPPEER